MSVRIIRADVLEGLRQLPDESVHCAVCSPPYWGLRDYGTAQWEGGDPACDHIKSELRRGVNLAQSPASTRGGAHKIATVGGIPFGEVCGKCGAVRRDRQLGLEPTLGEHIEAMVRVFREVRRVLRKDGTLWLNYGDSYATSINGRSAADTKALTDDDRTFRDKPFSTVGPIYAKRVTAGTEREDVDVGGWGKRDDGLRWRGGGTLKPKDLCGVPWRVALALQDDGWWLRQDIIWSKPNPMPESIKDRCTKAHEYIFLLAKSERYYFDAEAIQEAVTESTVARMSQDVANQHGSQRANGGTRANRPMKAVLRAKDNTASARNPNSAPHNLSAFEAENDGEYRSRNKRSVWEVATVPFADAFCTSCRSYYGPREKRKLREEKIDGRKILYCRCGRHDAWLSHFATFPPRLIEPCILAGCPKGGIVLDPFAGSGTTGMVADRAQRNAVLIELNIDYAEMAVHRLKGDAPLLMKVEAA